MGNLRKHVLTLNTNEEPIPPVPQHPNQISEIPPRPPTQTIHQTIINIRQRYCKISSRRTTMLLDTHSTVVTSTTHHNHIKMTLKNTPSSMMNISSSATSATIVCPHNPILKQFHDEWRSANCQRSKKMKPPSLSLKQPPSWLLNARSPTPRSTNGTEI